MDPLSHCNEDKNQEKSCPARNSRIPTTKTSSRTNHSRCSCLKARIYHKDTYCYKIRCICGFMYYDACSFNIFISVAKWSAFRQCRQPASRPPHQNSIKAERNYCPLRQSTQVSPGMPGMQITGIGSCLHTPGHTWHGIEQTCKV